MLVIRLSDIYEFHMSAIHKTRMCRGKMWESGSHSCLRKEDSVRSLFSIEILGAVLLSCLCTVCVRKAHRKKIVSFTLIPGYPFPTVTFVFDDVVRRQRLVLHSPHFLVMIAFLSIGMYRILALYDFLCDREIGYKESLLWTDKPSRFF